MWRYWWGDSIMLQSIMLADKAGLRKKPKGGVKKNGKPAAANTEKDKEDLKKKLFGAIGNKGSVEESVEQKATESVEVKAAETAEVKANRIRNELKTKRHGRQ